MALADRVLALKLVADVSSIEKGTKKADRRLKSMAKSAASWGKAVGGALVIRGIESVVDMFGDAIEGAQQGARELENLRDTSDRLGLSFDKVAKGFDAVSDAALKAGVDDTPVQRLYTSLIQQGDPAWKAIRKVNTALDVSAKLGIPTAAAGKLVQKAMDGNAAALKRLGLPENIKGTEVLRQLEQRFGGAAEAAANADPMRKALNEIGEAMETIAGVAVLPVLEGFGKVMKDTIAPAITDIADALAEVDFANLDWGAALKGAFDAALGAVVTAIEGDQLGNIAALGGAIAGGVFAFHLFFNAAHAMFKIPGWGAKALVSVAAKALGLAFSGAMFVASVFIGALSSMFSGMAATPAWKALIGVVQGLGRLVGTALQVGLIAGLTAGLLLLVQQELEKVLDPVLPDHPWDSLNFDRRARGGPVTRGTAYVVGERGPELFMPHVGGRIIPSMAMAASGGIVVNINMGVGDPIAVGREVERVLGAYRLRAGV